MRARYFMGEGPGALLDQIWWVGVSKREKRLISSCWRGDKASPRMGKEDGCIEGETLLYTAQ